MIQYEAGDFKAIWLGVDLTRGLGTDTFFEIALIGDMVAESFSANGEMAVSKLANRGAIITATYQQGSPTSRDLAEKAAIQDIVGNEIPVAPMTVTGASASSGYFVTLNAVLKAQPTQSYAAEIGEQSWMWVCESYFATKDPSTFTKYLKQYVDFSI